MIGQQLLSLLYGDPADQISRTLSGPNPNPGAPPPPGAGSGNGASFQNGVRQIQPQSQPQPQPQPQPQSQPPLAPANATQSPPDLASLYMQLHSQDQQASHIDRGMAMMASAFGTAQQQHDMMNYAQNTPVDDRTAALSKGILAQREVTAQQEHSRFMAGAAGMATLLGVTPEQAAWLSNDQDMLKEVLTAHNQSIAPTEAMKNVDAATKAYTQANPNATPEEIAGFKAKAMIGLTGGPMAEAQKIQAKDSQQFKDNALEDYTSVSNKLITNQGLVDQLLKDMPSTMAAIRDPEALTTGAAAGWLPSGIGPYQSTKDQAVKIKQLTAALTGQSLTDVKNVRNQREFDTLGRALTGALSPGNSQAQVEAALKDIQKKFLDARATAELAAGHRLTGDLVGHGQRDLLQPTLNGQPNPYYNGGSEEERKNGGDSGSSGGGKHYVWTADGGLQEK